MEITAQQRATLDQAMADKPGAEVVECELQGYPEPLGVVALSYDHIDGWGIPCRRIERIHPDGSVEIRDLYRM